MQIIKKLTQPKNSQEGQTFLDEVSSMLEEAHSDMEVLKSEKETILLTFDDAKIDECLNTELRLDKEVQTLNAAKKHLEAKIVELTDSENKAKAEDIKSVALKSQQRGLSIYDEYQTHAQAIAELVNELKSIERDVSMANRHIVSLTGQGDSVSSVFAKFRGDVVGYDLTEGHDRLGIRLPDPLNRDRPLVNMR